MFPQYTELDFAKHEGVKARGREVQVFFSQSVAGQQSSEMQNSIK